MRLLSQGFCVRSRRSGEGGISFSTFLGIIPQFPPFPLPFSCVHALLLLLHRFLLLYVYLLPLSLLIRDTAREGWEARKEEREFSPRVINPAKFPRPSPSSSSRCHPLLLLRGGGMKIDREFQVGCTYGVPTQRRGRKEIAKLHGRIRPRMCPKFFYCMPRRLRREKNTDKV